MEGLEGKGLFCSFIPAPPKLTVVNQVFLGLGIPLSCAGVCINIVLIVMIKAIQGRHNMHAYFDRVLLIIVALSWHALCPVIGRAKHSKLYYSILEG